MKDHAQETGSHGSSFRYAVFSLAALLVLSLGFVLVPREPPATPPTFSEQARAAAFSETLSLRGAGIALEDAAPGVPSDLPAPVLGRIVTLLTVQAQAFMLPGTPVASGSPASAPPPSTAEFAAALQASAAQRLKDAETADGGMARLLAGAGTAQLLAAEDFAAATGAALAAPPAAGLRSATAPANTGNSTASMATGCTAQPTGDGAKRAAALASAVAAELELVYAYQVALTRIHAASAAPALDFLAQHRDLRTEAEEMGRASCAALPPKPAGYALGEAFLAAPAAALGTLEAGTLPVYGDLVALSEGPDRAWALAALQSAARRTLHWGGPLGPVPGMDLTELPLPQLPEASPTLASHGR